MVVTACQDIEQNTEITVNYMDCGDEGQFLPRNRRRRTLKEWWKFFCQCPACSLTGESLAREEETRRRMREIQKLQTVTKVRRRQIPLDCGEAGVVVHRVKLAQNTGN